MWVSVSEWVSAVGVGVGVGIGIGVGVDVGTGFEVAVGRVAGAAAGLGFGAAVSSIGEVGMAATVAAIIVSIVASMSGVGEGVAVGRASATAVLTSALRSGVGIAGSPDPPHALKTNPKAIIASPRTFILPPNRRREKLNGDEMAGPLPYQVKVAIHSLVRLL